MKTVTTQSLFRGRSRIGLAFVALLTAARVSPGLSPSHAGLKKRVAVMDMAMTAAPSGSGNYTSTSPSASRRC